MLLRSYASRILWFSRFALRPVVSYGTCKCDYAEDFMQDLCEAEDVGDVEWTKVVMEVVVDESIVDGEEGCSCPWFG